MQTEIDKKKLLKLLVQSGCGFNKVIENAESQHFLFSIEEHTIYFEEQFSELIIFISTMGLVPVDEENLSLLHKLLIFHKTVLKTGTLVKKLSALKAETKQIKQTSNVISNPLGDKIQLEIPTPTIESENSIKSREFKMVSVAPSLSSQQVNGSNIDFNVNDDIELSEFIRSVKMS